MGQGMGLGKEAHGQTGQGCGELKASPATGSQEQRLTVPGQ